MCHAHALQMIRMDKNSCPCKCGRLLSPNAAHKHLKVFPLTPDGVSGSSFDDSVINVTAVTKEDLVARRRLRVDKLRSLLDSRPAYREEVRFMWRTAFSEAQPDLANYIGNVRALEVGDDLEEITYQAMYGHPQPPPPTAEEDEEFMAAMMTFSEDEDEEDDAAALGIFVPETDDSEYLPESESDSDFYYDD